MEYDMSEQEKCKRFADIDSLKGAAVCAVVWVHSGGGTLGGLLGWLGASGAYWVELFFILTVYLACHSLEGRAKSANGFLKVAVQWFFERIWRLTPLYYLALVVYMIIVPPGANIWMGTAEGYSAMNVIMHFLYLHGFFPYFANSIMWVEWYIGVMVIYLAIVPVLYRYGGKNKVSGIVGTVLIMLSVIGTCVLRHLHFSGEQYIWDGWVYTYSFIIHFPALICGMCLYTLRDMWNEKRYSNRMFAVSIIGYICLACLSSYFNEKTWIWLVRTLAFDLIFCLMILSKKISTCNVLNNRICQRLGQYSYSIYLFHFLLVYFGGCLIGDEAALGIIRSPLVWQIIKFTIIIALCFIFSVVYEKTIGERIYQWGKRKISGYFASL